MAHDVLISYSSRDKLQADAICNRLESEGIRCWIAPRDVPVGSEYADAIVKAIEAAQVLVLVYSNSANESEQVKREVERAVSEGTQIMPVRLEDVPMSKSFEYYVGSIHWLDAITPPLEAHIDKLAQNLKQVLRTGPDPAVADAARGVAPVGEPAVESAVGVPAGGPVGGDEPAVAPPQPPSRPAAAAGQAAGRPGVPDAEPSGSGSTPEAPGLSGSGSPPAASGRAPKWKRYAAGGLTVPVIVAGWLLLSGPSQRLVPNVTGTSLEAATQRLEEAGFLVTMELVESARAAGTVVGMSPAAGDEASVGSEVRLQLSGTLLMPDLTGVTLSRAHERLAALKVASQGFDPATIGVERLPRGPEGVVQRTEPGPGQPFLLGAPVTLFVAGETVGVPELAGRSWQQAVSDLREAELEARATPDWAEGAELGAVLWTRPPADAAVQRGSEVEVGVAARGGWVYLNRRGLEAGQVFRMASGLNLRERPISDARQLGVAPAGARVRVLQEPTAYGWVKIVLLEQ